MSKELLFSVTKKDFDIHWFSGTGCGGQNRNKHMNCCRLVHRDSGASATGQSHRDQQANLKEAFNRIVNSMTFKMWHSRMVQECLDKKSLEDKVDEMLNEKNLKVEVKIGGKWEEYSGSTD